MRLRNSWPPSPSLPFFRWCWGSSNRLWPRWERTINVPATRVFSEVNLTSYWKPPRTIAIHSFLKGQRNPHLAIALENKLAISLSPHFWELVGYRKKQAGKQNMKGHQGLTVKHFVAKRMIDPVTQISHLPYCHPIHFSLFRCIFQCFNKYWKPVSS